MTTISHKLLSLSSGHFTITFNTLLSLIFFKFVFRCKNSIISYEYLFGKFKNLLKFLELSNIGFSMNIFFLLNNKPL